MQKNAELRGELDQRAARQRFPAQAAEQRTPARGVAGFQRHVALFLQTLDHVLDGRRIYSAFDGLATGREGLVMECGHQRGRIDAGGWEKSMRCLVTCRSQTTNTNRSHV